jgi:plasmid stability protein
MKQITVRNVTGDLSAALDRERARKGMSLNATVLALLRRALGIGPGKTYDNGLGRHAGSWSEEEVEEFEAAVSDFDRIDEEMWS